MRFAGQLAPAPLRVGDLPDGGSYIVMELLDFKPFALLDPDAQRLLGRSLARMHMHQPDRHAFFGFGMETKVAIGLGLDADRQCLPHLARDPQNR